MQNLDSVEKVQKHITIVRENPYLTQSTLRELTDLYDNLTSANATSTRMMVNNLLTNNVHRPTDYDMRIAMDQRNTGGMAAIVALVSFIFSLIYMAANNIVDYMVIYIIFMICGISCFFG